MRRLADRWRGSWLARWHPALALAVAQPVGTALMVRAADGQHPFPAGRPLDVLGYALLAMAPAPLGWRGRFPAATVVAVFGLSQAYLLLGYPAGPVYAALVAAFLNCVVRGPRVAAHLTLAAGYGLTWLRGGPLGASLAARLGVAAWLLVLATLGEVIRARRGFRTAERARAAEAQAAKAEADRRRAGEERLRIAQDLHDVLAHHVSLIVVQAGVGLALFDQQPGQARAALATVRDAGNTALGELRAVLDILRDPSQRAPRAPSPLLSNAKDLDALADAAKAAGLVVQLRGAPAALPLLVDQAAYRITQEALTNAIRHAGPGATVVVEVDAGQDALTLRVEDDGRGSAPDVTSGGNGIPGMRERAAALGGTLVAGPRTRGGFQVFARLPLDGDS